MPRHPLPFAAAVPAILIAVALAVLLAPAPPLTFSAAQTSGGATTPAASSSSSGDNETIPVGNNTAPGGSGHAITPPEQADTNTTTEEYDNSRPGLCAHGFGVKNVTNATTSGVISSFCRICEVGKASTGGWSTCEVCPAGRFASDIGSRSCSPCLAGEVSAAGAAECLVCRSGTIASANHTVCQPCGAGSFSIAGDVRCRVCDAGTFNAKVGQPGCLACGAGWYNTRAGAVAAKSCHPCPAGRYCPDVATAQPLDCGPRQFSAPGSIVCEQCPRMFQAVPGRAACSPTASFYFIVALVAIFVILTLLCLVQCPRKSWGVTNRIESVL